MASATLHLSVLCLLLAATTHQSKADANFIEKTCQNTDLPDSCISMLQSDKRSFNATSVVGLTGIAFDIVIKDFSVANSAVNDIANNNPGTPTEEAANQCSELYGNAVDDLTEAQQDLASQAYSDAANAMAAAGDAPESCEEAFFDNSVQSPVTDQNNKVKKEWLICSQLVDLLQA